MQVADIVLAAARRIAGEGGGVVTLAQLQADAAVQVRIRAAERVIDVMSTLEHGGVRMVCRHPEPKWAVEA